MSAKLRRNGPKVLQRAVGVIYQPESERLSHHLRADIERRFDAVLFLDETGALEPLWDQTQPAS